jgi:hypothetical protein
MKVFVGFVLLLFFTACLKSEQSKKPLVSNFIKSEIERLSKEKPRVIKIATLNSKADTIITDSLDWKRELNIFLMNDLDSSQLVNYTMSDLFSNSGNENEDWHRVYIAKNPEEKIQQVQTVTIGNTLLSRIEIIIQKKHELFTYYKKLIYDTKTGYEISGSQDIKFVVGINYSVKVNYEK